MTRIVFALMWLTHGLPFRTLAAIGNGVGALLFWLIPERRRVTRINLAKCFPQMPADERERLARGAFKSFCRSFVDRAVLWWGSDERIRQMVKLEGLEHLDQAGERKIVLAPHFAGLDAAGIRLSMERDLSSLYSHQKDPVLDRLLYDSRTRFRPDPKIASRIQGLRPVVRWVREGIPLYFLPDMDVGARGAMFAPFFGVQAATVLGLPYIARMARALVVPCVARMLPDGGYVGRFYPAWRDYPSGDDAADVRRMNAFIEERILEMPEQYHWLHKRFKTRPPGEPRFY